MEVFRNKYIKYLINNHLNYYNYHHTLIFNNYKSFKSYQYKSYINKIIIYYDINKDLEYYFNKLPKEIKKLVLISVSGEGRGSNKDLIIPEGIEELTFSSAIYEHCIDNIRLPKSLKSLTLEDGQLDNVELSQFLPENLQVLTVNSKSFIKEGIKIGDLPKNLKYLKLTVDFNKSFNIDSLPASLESFEIHYSITFSLNYFYFPLKPNVFQHGLTSLLIGNYYFEPICKDVLPSTITTLSLYSYHQDISEIIPPNCTTLYTSAEQLISNIPNSITKLVYSVNDFRNEDEEKKLSLDSSSIPNSVKILHLSSTQELVGQNRLPDSVTDLAIRNLTQLTLDKYSPNNGSIKILHLPNCPSDLRFNEFHQSITDLKISPTLNFYFQSRLPKSLKKLSYFKNYKNIATLEPILKIDFDKLCSSLSVLSFKNDTNIKATSYPSELKALNIQSQSQFNIFQLSKLEILQLDSCYYFNIDKEFLKLLPSLEHLILVNCSEFTIENPSQPSKISIYLDTESYNSIKLSFTNDNYDEHYCLLNQFYNYSKIINFYQMDIFSNLIKNKFNDNK